MCDCLVALGTRTATHRTLFAKNSDRPPYERQDLCVGRPRRARTPVRTTYIEIDGHHEESIECMLSRPRWCWGAEHGVNLAGVAIGNETIYTTKDPREAPDALIGMDIVRLVLERAPTASEGVALISELLERYGQGGSGHDTSVTGRRRPYWSSFLVADPSSAFVVETSGDEVVSMRVVEAWAISNRTTIPEFDAAHRHPRQPVERLVDPRLHASRAFLDQRDISVDAMKTHLRSHVGGNDGWTVCMHAGLHESTTASMIAELASTDGRSSTVWAAQGQPCRTEYLRFEVADARSFLPAAPE